MSALPARTGITNTPSPNYATAEASLAALYDFLAQRLAKGTAGAGTATKAELRLARNTLGFGVNADLASAATLDFTGLDGNIVRITGTTAVSSILLEEGDIVTAIAVGALPLTYHATNHPVPGGMSYTCSPGDQIIYKKDDAGTIHMNIIPKSGNNFNDIGIPVLTPFNSAPHGALKANGAAVSRTTYAGLFSRLNGGFSQQSFTVSIASPAVFTKAAHGFVGGERLRLFTAGSLPTGLNTTTDYFVKYLDGATFKLSLTKDGADIATSGVQSGAHTYLQSVAGLGDGSTTFNVPDWRGEFFRAWDDGRGVDLNRALNSFQLDAFQSHVHQYNKVIASANGIGANTWQYQLTTGADTSTPTTDGVNGEPRLAAETRSRNVALLACIKY